MNAIKQALAKLDVTNDAHWTTDGLPRLDVVKGFGVTITRADLTNEVKGFNRADTSAINEVSEVTPSVETPEVSEVPEVPEEVTSVETEEVETEDPAIQAAAKAIAQNTKQVSKNPAAVAAHLHQAMADKGEPAELTEDEKIEKELDDANKHLIKASQRQASAVKAMDGLILRRAESEDKVSAADTIKAFQKSQAAQRGGQIAKQKAMAAAIKEVNENF